MQGILDAYRSGVLIANVQLQKSDPPKEVIDAFNDVQRARQDRDRLQNEAEAYANSIVPEARGKAEKAIQEARSEEHTSELQSLMRNTYAVLCLKKQINSIKPR